MTFCHFHPIITDYKLIKSQKKELQMICKISLLLMSNLIWIMTEINNSIVSMSSWKYLLFFFFSNNSFMNSYLWYSNQEASDNN